jgi:hypothetical protein
MGAHEADAATEVAERLARRLAAERCTNPPNPCPMHLTGARRQVAEVLAVIDADGWALRKVHVTPEQSTAEALDDIAAGDIRYPSRQAAESRRIG